MAPSHELDVELAERFGLVAETLLSDDTADATLYKIVKLAVDTLAACEHAGISYVVHRKIEPGPGTGWIPATMDALQSEIGQGPCLDAIHQHDVFVTGHLSTETRWPDFARRARAETGIESVLGVRLHAQGETFGALNLYATVADAFHKRDIALARVFGTHASVALLRSREREQLQRALESRQEIGQAIGIVMAGQHLTADAAYEVLRDASQRHNVKVTVIADLVRQTGQLGEFAD